MSNPINLNWVLKAPGDTTAIEAAGIFTVQGAVRAVGGVTPRISVTNVTTAGAATYTAAAIAGGVITRDPAGGARTDVTPTAALLIAGTPALTVDGDAIACYLINTADAAEAITIDPGSGVTIANAGQTIAQNESAILLFVRTSSTAVTCYIIGA